MDLSQRLDEMELAIHKPSFRKGTGRANEVNYWVFDYPPEKELEVRERVEYLKNKNDRGDDDFEHRKLEMAFLWRKFNFSSRYIREDSFRLFIEHFMWGAMPLSAPGSNQQVSTDNSRDCLGKVLRYIAG